MLEGSGAAVWPTSFWRAALVSTVMFLALLASVAQAVAAENGSPAAGIEFRGNLIFNDETYLAVLRGDAQVWSRRGEKALLKQSLQDFLYRAGYVLATVQVRRKQGRVLVVIDEGRLEKVIFRGAGSLRALQLKMSLSIPHYVFNRPNLERQLWDLSQRFGLKGVHYDLLPCRDVEHDGPQVDDLGAWMGQAIISPRAGYELHISLSQTDWDPGLSLDLGYDSPKGLELGLLYRGEGMLFDRDRWHIGGGLAGELRNDLDDDHYYPALTEGLFYYRWYTPPLIGNGFRPLIDFVSEVISRQRSDLDLEIYYRARLDGSLRLSYEFTPGLVVSIGGGADQRWIFATEMAETATVPVEEGAWLRPFAAARLSFSFDAPEVRRDRRHRLSLELRHFWVDGKDSLGRARLRYRKVFDFGWHDLFIESRATWLWGALLFDDQEPVGGKFLRGVFGGRYWVERVGNLALEFRFSLVRDLFKLSVFHDLACFGELRDTGGQQARVADSFGLGFHALILDLFQLSLYYGVGFSSDGSFDHGISGSLTKVF